DAAASQARRPCSFTPPLSCRTSPPHGGRLAAIRRGPQHGNPPLEGGEALPQLPPQYLPDGRLRQFGAELDVARALVPGEVLAAELHDLLGSQVRVLLDDVQLRRLARMLVRHA